MRRELKSRDHQCIAYSRRGKWTIPDNYSVRVALFTAHSPSRRTTLPPNYFNHEGASLFGACALCPAFLERCTVQGAHS